MRICAPDSWGSDFYNVAPKEGDCIVTKHRYSAFIGTDLDLILRSKGIENILVTGWPQMFVWNQPPGMGIIAITM